MTSKNCFTVKEIKMKEFTKIISVLVCMAMGSIAGAELGLARGFLIGFAFAMGFIWTLEICDVLERTQR